MHRESGFDIVVVKGGDEIAAEVAIVVDVSVVRRCGGAGAGGSVSSAPGDVCERWPRGGARRGHVRAAARSLRRHGAS